MEQDPSVGSCRHYAYATLLTRAVKTSLSLLCAELRGDPEPKKKRSKLSEATFGSPVSPAPLFASYRTRAWGLLNAS